MRERKEYKFIDTFNHKSCDFKFFRGHWCPCCNLELRTIEEILSRSFGNKVQVMAVSLQSAKDTMLTVEKMVYLFLF